MKITLVLLIALVACVAAPAGQPEKFKITLTRADDGVNVTTDAGRTVVTITCPTGISRAVIERTAEQWPEAVVLRLHLRGLSCFIATNGKVTLDAARTGTKVLLRKDGKEDPPLDRQSPFWMDIRAVGKDGKAVEKPVEGGYFEMTLPRAFFADNPRSIRVDWIDFYRK